MTWFFGVSLAVLLLSLFRPFNPINTHIFCRTVSSGALRILGIKLEKRGMENLVLDGPATLLMTHQGLLDMFLFGPILPKPTIVIGKKSLRWIPIWGWLFWLAGNLLIDRGNNEAAVNTMRRAKSLLVKNKTSIIVAPEGTRSRGRGLQPFKKGPFYLAIESGFPVVPLVASSYYGKMNYWRWRAGTIIVEALQPISTDGMTQNDVARLRDEAHARTKVALDCLDAEIASRA
jgi:1-acyl-sn-glycerol-3-phosphate acyltransferase